MRRHRAHYDVTLMISWDLDGQHKMASINKISCWIVDGQTDMLNFAVSSVPADGQKLCCSGIYKHSDDEVCVGTGTFCDAYWCHNNGSSLIFNDGLACCMVLNSRCASIVNNQWTFTGNWESSWCQLYHNWWHRILSLWQIHDDVIKWKHFPRYWPFVRGIHRFPVNSPHKDQWREALVFFFDLRQNERLSKKSWGWWFETPSRPLWRHCNVVMTVTVAVMTKLASDRFSVF